MPKKLFHFVTRAGRMCEITNGHTTVHVYEMDDGRLNLFVYQKGMRVNLYVNGEFTYEEGK